MYLWRHWSVVHRNSACLLQVSDSGLVGAECWRRSVGRGRVEPVSCLWTQRLLGRCGDTRVVCVQIVIQIVIKMLTSRWIKSLVMFQKIVRNLIISCKTPRSHDNVCESFHVELKLCEVATQVQCIDLRQISNRNGNSKSWHRGLNISRKLLWLDGYTVPAR